MNAANQINTYMLKQSRKLNKDIVDKSKKGKSKKNSIDGKCACMLLLVFWGSIIYYLYASLFA